MKPRIKLATAVLDCPAAGHLASFYAELLGWNVARAEADWVLLRDPQGGTALSFQSEPDYIPPVWPEEPEQQQKMLHLDFLVEDLDVSVAHAVRCGAVPAPRQYLEGVVVLFDPAGHPFCLFADPAYVWPERADVVASSEIQQASGIRWVYDEQTREDVSLQVMHRLRKWFNPASDIDAKSRLHREMDFLAAYDGDRPIGFLALKQHNQYTFEIFNMGVLEEFHGLGLGSTLIEVACAYCHGEGARFITIKTLADSAEYEPYERTRAFYRRRGFLPLEVFQNYWNPENPCLYMARYLG